MLVLPTFCNVLLLVFLPFAILVTGGKLFFATNCGSWCCRLVFFVLKM